MNIPRSEHPHPDRRRDEWISLNGEWEFEIDNADVGKEKKFFTRPHLNGKIMVPFCPESKLSGVENRDFMNVVWYRRDITVPEKFSGKRILLHIDACDYESTVYLNGKEVGTHKGGYTPFEFDITDLLSENNSLVIRALDDVRSGKQVCGKQSKRLNSHGCMYTRNTGIWQSVWLEAAEAARTVMYKAYPSIEDCSVFLSVLTTECALGGTLSVAAYYEGREVGSAETFINSKSSSLCIKLSEKHLWEIGHGRLYDLVFTLEKDGKKDILNGYFGLREVSLTNKAFYLNGKPVYLRFVLDQGYYPDGIITAPDDSEFVRDIETSMACGFNGARLHQKVFEPRFLYHADRLGYMVCGETGNWGLDHTDGMNIYNFLPEWIEEVERDISHPSIVMWCPFNETWDIDGRCRDVRLVDLVYTTTKALDKTRVVIADSGSFPTHGSDLHDVHDYEQDPKILFENYAKAGDGIVCDQLVKRYGSRQKYEKGKPIFVSEWGGIKWLTDSDDTAWGYGTDVTSEKEYFERLEGLYDVLVRNPRIIGSCYTQLTDVELEHNGIMTYDRKPKFPYEKYREIISRKAICEK